MRIRPYMVVFLAVVLLWIQSAFAKPPGALNWKYTVSGSLFSTDLTLSTDDIVYAYLPGGPPNGLSAINADGSLRWTTPGSLICSIVSMGPNRVIYASGAYGVEAYHPTGAGIWSSTTIGATAGCNGPVAVSSKGDIYVVEETVLYALDPSTGSKIWEYDNSMPNYLTAPAIGPNGDIYVGSWDDRLIAVDSSGSFKWAYKTSGDIDAVPAVGPDGSVYVGSQGGAFYAVDRFGRLKWSYPTGAVNYSATIGPYNTVYVCSYSTDKVFAFSPDGKLKWSYSLPGDPESAVTVGADGMLYVASNDALIALTSAGKVDWSYPFSPGRMASSPVIDSNGALYVGCDSDLYSINTSSMGLADSSWPIANANAQRSGLVNTPPDYDGWWYTPSEGGSGLSLAIHGSLIFMAWYAYEPTGEPVWYVSWLTKSSSVTYEGDLRKYYGWELGQAWAGAMGVLAGSVSLTFNNQSDATLKWDLGGTDVGAKSIRKYMPDLVSSGSHDSRGLTGWYWDKSYSGMGFFLEAYGDTLYLGWYHYGKGGAPRWWVLGGWKDVGGFPDGTTIYSGNLLEFSGGQAVGGAWQPASETTGDTCTLTIANDGSTIMLNWGGHTTFNLSPYDIMLQ